MLRIYWILSLWGQWSALLFPTILRGRCCHYLHVIRQWRLTSLCNLSEVTQYKAELVSEFTRLGSGIHTPLQVERMGGHAGGCGGRGGQGQMWVKNWQKGQSPERNPFWYLCIFHGYTHSLLISQMGLKSFRADILISPSFLMTKDWMSLIFTVWPGHKLHPRTYEFFLNIRLTIFKAFWERILLLG